MHTNDRVPVLLLRDGKSGACLSIEFSDEGNGNTRLFAALSGKSLALSQKLLGQIGSILDELGAKMVMFEDICKNLLSRQLKKLGFAAIPASKMGRNIKVSWLNWNEALPANLVSYFGINDNVKIFQTQGMRRMLLSDRGGPIGEIAFTDYGRFTRCKANRHAIEGFGRIYREDVDPSIILSALREELEKEGKRYLILGREFESFSGPVHPFLLWHMVLSGVKGGSHRCRIAAEADIERLAELTTEYEDGDYQSAINGIKKRYADPGFRYLLTSGDEGFVLIKFKGRTEGKVHDLFVSPCHQAGGLGDELVRASLSELAKSCSRIDLNTIYPRAKRLYEKYGFETLYTDLCVPIRQRIMRRK